MRSFFWILVALMAVVLASFAASNRESTLLGLWPLPFVVELPLYLAVLSALLTGFVTGALAAWLAGRRWRRELRSRRRRVATLEHELAAARARLPGAVDSSPPQLAARG